MTEQLPHSHCCYMPRQHVCYRNARTDGHDRANCRPLVVLLSDDRARGAGRLQTSLRRRSPAEAQPLTHPPSERTPNNLLPFANKRTRAVPRARKTSRRRELQPHAAICHYICAHVYRIARKLYRTRNTGSKLCCTGRKAGMVMT